MLQDLKDQDLGKFHFLEPDYTTGLLQIPEKTHSLLAEKISFLYGEPRVKTILPELERILKVYYAHKTDYMFDFESGLDNENPFTESDVILITYGDLIREPNKLPLSTLADFSHRYLKDSFNILHLLPFFPSSSDRGFAIQDFRQVDPALGSWDHILRLKDHFKLMFDGVINHVSSKSYWFQEFLNGNPEFKNFFTVLSTRRRVTREQLKLLMRPRTSEVLTPFNTFNGEKYVWTTFSSDQIDLKYQNPRVLLRIIEILLYYVRRGADLIRLDAVTYLWDELGTCGAHLQQTHQIIKLFRIILDTVAPHVALITETNVPHEDNISYFGNGYDEAQMVYNFALPPLLLHSFLSGDATKLSAWAEDLCCMSSRTTFLNFLDSHDGIGVLGARNILTTEEINAMTEKVIQHGGLISQRIEPDGSLTPYELNITFFSALNREDSNEKQSLQVRRYLAARSIALALKGVPGVYLHGLIGSSNDRKAVDLNKNKRDINRTIIDARVLESMIEDSSSRTGQIFSLFTGLINLRKNEPAFHPNALQSVIHAGKQFFSIMRYTSDMGRFVLVIVNITNSAEKYCANLIESSGDINKWDDLISGKTFVFCDGCAEINLEPYEYLWLLGLK